MSIIVLIVYGINLSIKNIKAWLHSDQQKEKTSADHSFEHKAACFLSETGNFILKNQKGLYLERRLPA